MKTKLLSVVLAAGGLASGGWLGYAQQLNPNQLPPAVQQAINSVTGAGGVTSVQQLSRDGTPEYKVQAADGRVFYVSQSGQLMNTLPAAAPTPATPPPAPPAAVPTVAADASAPRSGYQLTFDELPAPVQNAVRAEAGTTPIGNVGQINVDGQTAYVVTFNRDGQSVHMRVDPTGRVLSGTQLPTTAPPRTELAGGSRVAFDLLPPAVQTAIRQYSMGAPILDVTKGSIQGQTMYQVAFLHRGKTVELQIAQNGSLVRDALNDQYLASVGMLPSAAGTGRELTKVPVRDWQTAPMRQPLANATSVAFQSVPEPVRRALLTYAAGNAIGSIQRGTNGGRTIYEAQLHPHGQRVDLRVTDTGALVNDQVNDRFLADLASGTSNFVDVGQAPTAQSLSATGSSAGLAPLSNETPLAYTDLPVAVRTTLTSKAGDSIPIDGIREGTLNGKTIYDVSFTRGGRTTNMRIADDGSVLNSTTTSP